MQQEVIQGFRLSPQQKRLWLLEGNRATSLARCAVCLEGALDAARLQEAAHLVVAGHEILRTNFRRPAGVKLPVQIVSDDARLEWRALDASATSAARESVIEEATRPFDLERDPAARFSLLSLSEREHVLFITLPALCADARTLRNLTRAVARAYRALSDDATEANGDETVQYVQFSEWQRDLLESDDAPFWRELNLAAAHSPSLPLESHDAPTAQPATRVVAVAPSARLASLVEAACAKLDVAPHVFLQTCWQTLLWRLTGQPEIVISVPGENRVYEEMEDALGLYANWLPVPCRMAVDLSFAEALAQVGGALAAAREWQEYYSWERLVTDGAAAAPAQPFDIAFDFEEQPAPEHAAGLTFTLERSEACAEPFKLRLSCCLRGDALGFEFHYDASTHASESVRLLAARFVKLIESAAADQSQHVGALDVLPEGERRRLLVDWNDTRETNYDHTSFQLRFEAQAAATPGAEAVFCEGRSLSFGELNRRANQLARHLRGRGVAAQSRVVLCMERSEEMLVGLLGIWKAGGVYVPVDASQPPARLQLLLADVQAQAVLTQERLKEKLPPHDAATVCIDADRKEIARESDANLGLSPLPQHLAYIIYTSGSTGVPKGVMIEHASLMNLAHALAEAVHGAPVAPLRVSLNAPLAFDSSVKQLLQLLCGHALYVVPEEVRRDTDELLSYIKQHRIDVLDCTPSQLKLLVEAGMSESPESAPRRVLVGGEAVDETLWSQLAADAGRAFYNVYGPTECTVDATACRVRADVRRPVIGRPLANTQIYILDGSLNPVPVGVAGELLIGGDGLARGYLNRPELTAERFIPDPFSTEPGARLYRTGDLARFLADGQIEFVGRVDFQVKIRGSRIELGEIESALGEHPMVRRAVVMAREDAPGDKRLAAYVVARQGTASVSAPELRAFLQERLPDYMIPAAFVLLDVMPLNANGKVNRDALPAPDGLRDETGRDYVAPRTPVEELLASVWQQLLGVERVGALDNFFELGGHSLLATQVVSQLRKAFQIELPLRTLFERPELAQLAESIEATLKGGREMSASPITRARRDESLPLSFAQQRLWFLYQMDPQSAFYNIPAHLRLAGKLDADALKRALNEIVNRHESLRTNLHTKGGQPVQVVAAERPLSLPVFDLMQLPAAEREQEARQLVEQEARRPFDLATDALLRAMLVKLDDAEHLLLLTFHHIVSDGWSAGIFIRELDLLYRAFASGDAPALAPLEVQYADFALWQRSAEHAASLAPALDYWRQKMGDLPPALDLPTDFPRPPRQRFSGSTLKIEMPRSLAEELRNLSRREGATLFMTLLAGWQALLARYTGQADIVVGTPIAGRTRAEVEGLIGFFVNTLPLRTNFDGDPNVRQLIGRVRETALGAFTNQEVPFELLVEELRPERDLSRSPLFQVLFILQNAHRERPALGDLAVDVLGVDSGTAKFDLTLSLEETEDGGLHGWIEYDTDLFAPQTIERLANHYEVLLGAMTGDATRAVSDLPLMPEAERRQLLEEFNDTRRAYPSELTVVELFEQQAARTPAHVALVAGEEALTYAELNARADRLAQHLRTLGVTSESLVGVCVERTARLVTALLAVLKAGGAYVPLDPNYPAQRLAYMLEDSAAEVLLTERELEGRLPVSNAAVVYLDELPYADDATAEAATTNDSAASATRRAGAGNLAYVIYTSGSTGKPKGVAITHRSLANFLHSMRREPGLTAHDTLVAVTSLSFDIAALELYLPLICGARLVLASREEAADAARLQQRLAETKATVMQATPATWRMLTDAGWRHDGSLKLLCGGEALPLDLAQRLIEWGAPVWNLYGPTETTIWSTLKQISPTQRAITIGRPIDNTHIYVLDAHLSPVALGVTGDLYIGGDGLARGYLHRPDLTAERFIPDPHASEAGARMYRTGDVARWRADGELEFLGRSDQQVKVRGYRIELGEVEAAVSAEAGVRQCVAVVREEEATGDKRLVAYVVAEEGASAPTSAELRAGLRGRMPEYMVPSVFVVLDELPLTPNGKVDRKRLPAPERGAGADAESFVAPRNALEETLAGYWVEVLGVERVGINDNFFNLGGHSLLAVQVVARVRDTFQVELPLRDLFEMPTVAGLAETLLQQETEPGSFEKLAQIMRQLDQLSDEEAGLLLQQEQLTVEAGEGLR
nr:condensation domain-containing protein [uncultured bacterium]